MTESLINNQLTERRGVTFESLAGGRGLKTVLRKGRNDGVGVAGPRGVEKVV